MKKNILTVIIVIIILGAFYFITSKKPAVSPTTSTVSSNYDVILYWGQGCSHCEKVKEYIQNNQIDQKLKINQKEIHDQNNSQEFQKNVQDNCSELISQEGIGIPVAFDIITKKCYQGDTPIIDYLTEKTK